MPYRLSTFSLLTLCIALPAWGQEAGLAQFEAAASDAGWSLTFAPASGEAVQARELRLQKDDRVITADSLSQASGVAGGALTLREVRMTQVGRPTASGEVSARLVEISDFGALNLLGEPEALPLCQREGRPMTLRGETVRLSADPDAMAEGQAGPETVDMGSLSISAVGAGPLETCRIELRASARAIRARAADGSQADIADLTLYGAGEVAQPGKIELEIGLRGAMARNGAQRLLGFEALTITASQDGQLMADGGSGLLAGLTAGQGAFRMDLRGLDLPLRGLLPMDLALPEAILSQIPEERITGEFSVSLTLAAGDAGADLNAELSGFSDLNLRLSARLPASSGGVEVLPGIPAEVAGITLSNAELHWQDLGANAIIAHYSGDGIAQHVDGLLAPAGRILSEEALADLRGAVAGWLEAGLAGGASLLLEPDEPVSLTQVGSLLLFAPDAVPELLGISTRP